MKHIFIVNTHAGDGKFSENLRNSLSNMKDFEYFIFNTRQSKKESDIIKQITRYFKGEKLRIYSCGGSGTFRNIMNSVDQLDNVEFAFYPCGMTNDFLKVFGDDEKYFHDIENLINGDVHMIDYIQTNFGRSLNSFSIGMDTDTLEGMERYRPFSTINGNLPYFLSIISALFGIKNIEYEVTLDGVKQSGPYFELFFGNGPVIGGNVRFGTEGVCNNNRASIFIGPKVNTLTILPHVLYSTSGHVEKTLAHGAQLGFAKEMTIRRLDGKPFPMNFDGEMSEPCDYWHAQIVHNGLAFIIPKQVKNGFEKEGK